MGRIADSVEEESNRQDRIEQQKREAESVVNVDGSSKDTVFKYNGVEITIRG